MHLRIQTYGTFSLAGRLGSGPFLICRTDNKNAQEVLEKGLDDLMALCDVVEKKFDEARNDFENRMVE